MATHAPEMPILVDDETGVWTTDALPMLYVPRHFFVNNHIGIEEVLGAEKYAEILYKAGYKSAWHWCEKEAECHGLSGVAVFEHYMKRLSQRGWGLFEISPSTSRPVPARCAWITRPSSTSTASAGARSTTCSPAGSPVPWTRFCRLRAAAFAPSPSRSTVPRRKATTTACSASNRSNNKGPWEGLQPRLANRYRR